MRALFVHQNFPAQYRHVAPALARRPGTQVIALGENGGEALPGVQHLRYKPPATGAETTHRYFDKVTFPAGCMNGWSHAVGGSRLWFPLTPKFRVESMGLHESGVGRGRTDAVNSSGDRMCG